jgi:PqqD family protein of HPr-rel-A system
VTSNADASPAAGPRPADPSYRLAEGTRIVTFGGEAAAFNPFSWETHLFNEAAALALARLREGECTVGDIETAFAAAIDDDRPRARAYAEQVLAELATLRLVIEQRGS